MRWMPTSLALPALAALCLAGCIEESPFAHMGQPRSPHAPSAPAPSSTPPMPSSSTPAPSSAPARPQPVAPASAAPAAANGMEGAHAAGAVFGNALQVVAYRIDPPSAQPGQQVTVTTFLRAIQPITEDMMMFVHVDDSEGRPERVNGDHWPAGHKVPMTQWKPNEVVRDSFTVVLNAFNESSAATVWLGFYDPNKDSRMPLTNANQVKNDSNNRYALADIPIIH